MERIPGYDDFKRGLRSSALSDLDLDVLDLFLRAEAFSLTATELTAELGRDGHRYGNLRIGTLGRNLAEAMSFTPNLREGDGTPMYWNVVASGCDRQGDEHFVWTLHPDLVAALQQFPRRPDSGRRDPSATPADELPEVTLERRQELAARRAQRRRDRGIV